MKCLLLSIKRILYRLGIDISFVKRKEERSAWDMNDVESANKAWSEKKISRGFLSKEVLDRYNVTISILMDHKVDLSGKSVIDVGCGNGMLLKFLSEHYPVASQTGMEYAEAALELAAKLNPAASYIVHDINQPYHKEYDAVLCTEVLEHILHPANAFKNLLEMVLDGGILLITVPNGRFDTYTGHINFWSPESWKVFVEENSGNLRHDTGKNEKSLLYALIYKENK